MLASFLIVILLAFAIGVVIRRSYSNKNAAPPKQAPIPFSRLQAKTDIEAALDFEDYKIKKETSVNDYEKVKSEIQSAMQDMIKDLLQEQRNQFQEFIQTVNSLQHEIIENQRKLAEQHHYEIEKGKTEIRSAFIPIQKENQLHLYKTNEMLQNTIKDLLREQQKKESSINSLQHEIIENQRKLAEQFHHDYAKGKAEIQSVFIQVQNANNEMKDWIQKKNDKINQEIQTDIHRTEKHIQHEIRATRQFVKDEINNAILKATTLEAPPTTMAAEIPKNTIIENLEQQLNNIEMTENQIQTNIFNELNHQLADAQNKIAQIHAQLEILQLLHALECEFNNQV